MSEGTNRFAADFPVTEGRPVLQGHADYCSQNGHATYTRNGIEAPYCPRCGETKSATPELPGLLDTAHDMTIRFSDGSAGIVHSYADERAAFHAALAHYGAAPADVAAVIVNDIRIVGGPTAYA